MSGWGLNVESGLLVAASVTALATIALVIAAWYAARLAKRAADEATKVARTQADIAQDHARIAGEQHDLSAKLVAIESARDRARLLVLPNLYGTVDGAPPDWHDEPWLHVTFLNDGGGIAGPIWYSLWDLRSEEADFAGYFKEDPPVLRPGTEVTGTIRWNGNDPPWRLDNDRRGMSDKPADLSGDWPAVRLVEGVFICAWDTRDETAAWFPDRPSKLPDNRPPGPL